MTNCARKSAQKVANRELKKNPGVLSQDTFKRFLRVKPRFFANISGGGFSHLNLLPVKNELQSEIPHVLP